MPISWRHQLVIGDRAGWTHPRYAAPVAPNRLDSSAAEFALHGNVMNELPQSAGLRLWRRASSVEEVS